MSKRVTFYLGLAVNLDHRTIVIRRRNLASDGVTDPGVYYQENLGASDTAFSIVLAENVLWQASLKDTLNTGQEGPTRQICFVTSGQAYPGPASEEGEFRIYSMEDESSSSVSSSSPSSSSASSSSQSVSSVSSQSASSASSSSSSSKSSGEV